MHSHTFQLLWSTHVLSTKHAVFLCYYLLPHFVWGFSSDFHYSGLCIFVLVILSTFFFLKILFACFLFFLCFTQEWNCELFLSLNMSSDVVRPKGIDDVTWLRNFQQGHATLEQPQVSWEPNIPSWLVLSHLQSCISLSEGIPPPPLWSSPTERRSTAGF